MVGSCDWLSFVSCCYGCDGGYTWRVNRVRASERVIRKDIKYNLISPFWFDTRVEVFSWIREIVLGKKISSQVRSSSREADF